MRCLHCKQPLRDGHALIPIVRWVESEKHSDFATDPIGYVHATHVHASDHKP